MHRILRRTTLWLVLVALSPSALAQEAKGDVGALPVEWEGVWRGSTLRVTTSGVREQTPMVLEVRAVPGGSTRTWKITYGDGPDQETRPYELSPVAGEPGRLLLDEKNGLLIDNQLVGKVLYSQFVVTTNLVAMRFELEGDRIAVEMTMYDVAAPRKSQLTGGNIEVTSYRFKSIQSGVLERQPAAAKQP
jgi:hypothetical protein